MPEVPNSEARPVQARVLHMVFPDHTNHLGTLFGGQALAWMDKAAFIAASRYARRTVVTARSEQVDFRLPVRQGQLVRPRCLRRPSPPLHLWRPKGEAGSSMWY